MVHSRVDKREPAVHRYRAPNRSAAIPFERQRCRTPISRQRVDRGVRALAKTSSWQESFRSSGPAAAQLTAPEATHLCHPASRACRFRPRTPICPPGAAASGGGERTRTADFHVAKMDRRSPVNRTYANTPLLACGSTRHHAAVQTRPRRARDAPETRPRRRLIRASQDTRPTRPRNARLNRQ
jgi:hypothetical protein